MKDKKVMGANYKDLFDLTIRFIYVFQIALIFALATNIVLYFIFRGLKWKNY